MHDYVEIGCTPAAEDCEQLGDNYNSARARAECNAFRNQIRRHFGPEPEGAVLVIRSNHHDFGTYYEVACKYDENNEAAANYAWECENIPEHWDDEAKQELGI